MGATPVADHRRLQRSLFRMQLSPSFAAALRARDPECIRSTGLNDADLELLLALDPAGVSADPGGRRQGQLLGNCSGEFMASVFAAEVWFGFEDVMPSFLGAEEFHSAIANDTSLPLAFGDYLARTLTGGAYASLHELLRLQRALAAARRSEFPSVQVSPGEWRLAPGAQLLELAAGTLGWLAELGRVLEGAEAPSHAAKLGDEREWVLLSAAPKAGAQILADVQTELLQPTLRTLLLATRDGLVMEARDEMALRCAVSRAELDAFAEQLAREGVLLLGK